MRTLLAVMGVALMACTPKRIEVANTPEGQACRRECMQIFTTCMAGRGGKHACRNQENECLATCPGQIRAAASPANAPAADEPLPVPPGQACVARDMPEWKSADAAGKKALLERCRAPAPESPDAGQ